MRSLKRERKHSHKYQQIVSDTLNFLIQKIFFSKVRWESQLYICGNIDYMYICGESTVIRMLIQAPSTIKIDTKGIRNHVAFKQNTTSVSIPNSMKMFNVE